MSHLELDILGPQNIPWKPHVVAFADLRVLRVNRVYSVNASEVDHCLANVVSFSRLEELFIYYSDPQVMSESAQTDRVFHLPNLKVLFMNDYFGYNRYTYLRPSLSNLIEVYNTPHKWRTFPIDLDQSNYLPKPVDPSPEAVDEWIRNLRYINLDTKLIEHVFSGIVSDGPNRLTTALASHPFFIPLIARILRTHAKEPSIWLTLVPALGTIFGELTSLSSPPSSATDNAVNGSVESVAMRQLIFDGSIETVAMRQLIFENMRPLLEEAVAAHTIDFSSVSPYPSLEDCFLIGPASVSERTRSHTYAAHLQLLRFICMVAKFPSGDIYPSRLCLSHSSSIASYVAQPWHRLYTDPKMFRLRFLRLFTNLDNNGVFCHAMHENGFDDTVEEVMEKWCPQVKWAEPKFGCPTTPALSPLPAIMGSLLPRHIHHLIRNRPKLVEKLIRMLPYDAYGEWVYPISIITSSHACHAPSPVICQSLPKYVLWSSRIHNGDLGAHVMVFSGSFCQFCRENYVIGLSSSLESQSIARSYGIPINGFEFMAKRIGSDKFNVWKSVASWVLESDSTSKKWLSMLKAALISSGQSERAGIHQRGEGGALEAEAFFNHLCDVVWQATMANVTNTQAYINSLSWETSNLLETVSILSQSPPFCDLAWNSHPTSLFDFIGDLFFKIGNPSSALSIMYHVTCYRGETFVATLEQMRLKVERNEKGGRRITHDQSFPCRLFTPLHYDQSTQEEDMLSAISETLLAGILALSRSHLFITLRVLANISFYHRGMHNILKAKSKYVPKLLAHAIALAENDGEVLGVQLLICEIFGELSSTDIEWLPVPVKRILTKESMLHYIAIAEGSGQPWWESCESFLLRSIFNRGLHLVLEPDTTKTKLEALNSNQIETITYLLDAVMRLSKIQDITTQEAAFQTLIVALSAPDSSDMSEMQYSLKILAREVAQRVLKNKYGELLKEQIGFQHFGYDSKVKVVGALMDK